MTIKRELALATGYLIIGLGIGAALATSAKAEDVCPTVGETAHEVMSYRQSEIPMSTLLTAITGNNGNEADLVRSIILDAYRKPAYTTDKVQKRVQDEFRNKWELRCYENGWVEK